MAKCVSLIIWGGSITIGLLLAIMMTRLVWQRSQSTPTLTAVDSYYYPIYKVPFPAVTLCNINIVYRPAFEQISKLVYIRIINMFHIYHTNIQI